MAEDKLGERIDKILPYTMASSYRDKVITALEALITEEVERAYHRAFVDRLPSDAVEQFTKELRIKDMEEVYGECPCNNNELLHFIEDKIKSIRGDKDENI